MQKCKPSKEDERGVEDRFFNKLSESHGYKPADLFLYSYEAEFIQNIWKSGEKKLAKQFNPTFRYIDDVLSLNNPKFSDSIDLIYPHNEYNGYRYYCEIGQ